jgi:hypothetical protein
MKACLNETRIPASSKTKITITRKYLARENLKLNPSASRIDFGWNLFRSLFIDKIVIEEDE